jgi:hypothetical protein
VGLKLFLPPFIIGLWDLLRIIYEFYGLDPIIPIEGLHA